uniref:Ig-like domain-containing protein n=1 Tax=Pelusios castaneus TaxID=367368 RepID=A0A8C8VNZ8_9SAUR
MAAKIPLLAPNAGSGAEAQLFSHLFPFAATNTPPSVFPLVPCAGDATTTEVTFGCFITGYFPEPVTVKWNPGSVSRGVKTFPSMISSSGLYSLSSQLTVPATSWRVTTYQCDVQHEPTRTSISKQIESRDGAVHVYHSSCSSKPGMTSIQLLCFVSGFYPMPLTVTWLVDDQPVHLDVVTEPAKKIPGTNTFSTRSVVKVAQSEWLEGKVYTCKVFHPGTKSTVQDHARKCTDSSSTSDIKVFLVPPSPAALFVDLYPKITCLVVNLPSPSDLQVVWSREKQGPVNPEPMAMVEQYNDTYTASISLPIFGRDWEDGETFICKVGHPDLPSPIEKAIAKKPGKRSAPGVYLLRPHPDELASSRDTVSLTCLVRGFFPDDISVQWQKNQKPDKSLEYITTSPMKDGAGDSTYFLYSKLKVSKESWNSGDTYTCMAIHEALSTKLIQKTVSKTSGK